MKHIDEKAIKVLPINFRVLRTTSIEENGEINEDKLVFIGNYNSLQAIKHHYKHISKTIRYDLGQ